MNFFKIRIFRKLLLTKKKITFFDNKSELSVLKKIVTDKAVIGLDTEFDWRNTYFPILSLMQISTNKEIFLIDCFKRKDFSLINEILCSKKILKIIHSARSDVTVIFSFLGIKTNNVFDTQIAEKLFSNEICSYAKIVKKYFDLDLPKSETRSNWLKRPFTENQLSYASEDVNYLIHIYRMQLKILKKKKLLSQAIKLSKLEVKKGNKDLKNSRLEKINNSPEIYKRIFLWRENLAIEKNIPAGYIFKDSSIKKLAKLSTKDDKLEKKIFDIFGDSLLTEKFIKGFF